MANTFAKFKENALKKEGVKAAYDSQTPEFVALDQFLRARADAALTQSEVAQRMHTTQSVVARIETAIQTLAQPHGDAQQGVAIMVLLIPVQLGTGLLLWDIKAFAGWINMFGGMKIMDTIHVFIFLFFTSFLFVHVYLATLGHTVTAAYKGYVYRIRRGRRTRTLSIDAEGGHNLGRGGSVRPCLLIKNSKPSDIFEFPERLT